MLFLTKKRSTLEEAGETVVYVDRKSIKIWIATLSKIGIISKSDVRLVQSVDQARLEFLENKDQDGWGYTLVSSLLYSRFYSSILDYRIESRQKFFIV